jgi:hypothetical protein
LTRNAGDAFVKMPPLGVVHTRENGEQHGHVR